MVWVAIKDTDTCEVSEFVQATEEQVLDLMDAHRADKHDATRFCLQDVEGGRHIVYRGIAYKGRFGYNILVASDCAEVYSGLYCGHY